MNIVKKEFESTLSIRYCEICDDYQPELFFDKQTICEICYINDKEDRRDKKMNKLFKYQGHTLKANIFGDAQLEVESLKAEPLKFGVYPVNFAEGEVWDLLAEVMESVHTDTIEEADKQLQNKIEELINKGILGHA